MLCVEPQSTENGGVQINATVLYVRVAPPWCVTQSSRVRPPSYTSESRPLGASSSHHEGALDGPLGDLWTRHWPHNLVGSTDMGPSMGGYRMAWGLVAVRFRLRYPRGTRIGLLGADWKLGAMAPHILGSAQARGSADIRRVMLTPAMMADRGCGRRARSVGNSRRGGTSCGGAYKILASFSFHKGWQGPTEAQLMGR
ncbi:hypothetical protein PCANC_00397 [Puccinia coronata f. sp. avenae]|uniref:Uncharacterized protein n=1 Tax=Puccinia coronata f. sp. avenae TaxID=200324 RepID=A0A2N5RUJ3_9BASI|nr:hypothetical protein PCANC_28807 [Puccinia coronata f. sp. avenae]PLW58686.1 hypothetical protein PCANC_00397 [Puccinia coronata f. sp. avenae]